MDEATFLAGIKGKIDITKLPIIPEWDKWSWDRYYCSYYAQKDGRTYQIAIFIKTYEMPEIYSACFSGDNLVPTACSKNPPADASCICLLDRTESWAGYDPTKKGYVPDDIANAALAALPYVQPKKTLNITSVPLDAKVFIDGEEIIIGKLEMLSATLRGKLFK